MQTTDFTIAVHARWPDMDFNGHMRNAAYLGVAEDCRMQYFAARGFEMDEFARRRIGPVVMRDELVYRRELRLLERATVTLTSAGLSDDGSRFVLRNTVLRDADGEPAAVVTSTGGWLDLDHRRLAAPPPELADLLRALPRDDDFAVLPSSAR
jgi:acyl-CoA thioester hydrolase